MKKFSINSLKVVLLLIIGLCVLSITSSVEAAPKVIRTYYAYNGGTLTIQREKNATLSTKIYNKNTNVGSSNTVVGNYTINSGSPITKVDKDGNSKTFYSITLPNTLTTNKSYYITSSSYVRRKY